MFIAAISVFMTSCLRPAVSGVRAACALMPAVISNTIRAESIVYYRRAIVVTEVLLADGRVVISAFNMTGCSLCLRGLAGLITAIIRSLRRQTSYGRPSVCLSVCLLSVSLLFYGSPGGAVKQTIGRCVRLQPVICHQLQLVTDGDLRSISVLVFMEFLFFQKTRFQFLNSS